MIRHILLTTIAMAALAANVSAEKVQAKDWSAATGSTFTNMVFTPDLGATLRVSRNDSHSQNILARSNGGKIDFLTSEYTKNFGNGPYQASFLNDGITTSEVVESRNMRRSIYGADSISRRKHPFPEEFIFSFKDDISATVDTFVVYNGAAGDGDGAKSEMKRFSLYSNSAIIEPDDLLSVETDGGGWSYKDSTFEELTIDNVLGKGLFAKEQQSHKYVNNSWIQSKNSEYTINTNDPKWVTINFVEPTEIASIYIASDDSANLHNQETDIYNLEIAIILESGKEQIVYSNRSQQMVDSDFIKGYSVFFEPVKAQGVTFRFQTEEYVEWQRVLIFKRPWDRFFMGVAAKKIRDYGPEIFRFNPERLRFLRLSVESNYGSKNWLDIGELEVYNGKPVNIASRENDAIVVDCLLEGNSEHPSTRLIDGKILAEDEYVTDRPDDIAKRNNHIVIDFGKNKSFDRVVHWNSAHAGPKTVTISYALEAMRFSEIGTFDLKNSENKFPRANSLTFEPEVARYIKLSYDKKSWSGLSMKIAEIEVYQTVTSYHTKGRMQSQIYDAKSPSIYEQLVINSGFVDSIPKGGYIELAFVSGQDAGLAGEVNVSTFIFEDNLRENRNIAYLTDKHNGDRYYRFNVKMGSLDKSKSPVLNSVIIDYKNVDEIVAEADTIYLEGSFKQARAILLKIEKIAVSPESRKKVTDKIAEIDESTRIWINNEYAKAKALSDNENFKDTILVCEKMDRRFPDNHKSKQIANMIADANIGIEFIAAHKAYMRRKGHWKAVEALKGISATYRNTRWAERAQDIIKQHQEKQMNLEFAKAQKEFDDQRYPKAITALEAFVNAYPYSQLKLKARKLIAESREMVARKIFNDGVIAYNGGKYFDARTKFKAIVDGEYRTYVAKASEYIEYSNDKIIEGEYQLAILVQAKRRYQEAIKSFQAIAESFPGTKWADMALLQIKKTKEMRRNNYEAAAQKEYNQALVFYDAKQYGKAMRSFTEFRRSYKDSSLASVAADIFEECQVILMTQEVDRYLADNKIGKAASVYTKILELDRSAKHSRRYTKIMSKKLREIYDAARTAYRGGEYQIAYDLFEFIIDKFPNSDWADRSKSRISQARSKI